MDKEIETHEVWNLVELKQVAKQKEQGVFKTKRDVNGKIKAYPVTPECSWQYIVMKHFHHILYVVP